jgi:hypothetical protein
MRYCINLPRCSSEIIGWMSGVLFPTDEVRSSGSGAYPAPSLKGCDLTCEGIYLRVLYTFSSVGV